MYIRSAQFHRAMPRNLAEADHSIFQPNETYVTSDLETETLESAWIHPRGEPFKRTDIHPKYFPNERLYSVRNKRKHKIRGLVARVPPFVIKRGQTTWITDLWSDNYFHWLTDCAPKLIALREAGSNVSLLLPHRFQRRDYVRSVLETLGVHDVAYLPTKWHSAWLERLEIVPNLAVPGNYNEPYVRKVGECLRRRSGAPEFQSAPHRRIFISRAKAGVRRLANEDEIRPILHRYGFETHFFEDYSFDKQIQLMSTATHVAGVHGAGLTNMMFMPPGGIVIELRRQADHGNLCYFALASCFNHPYFYVSAVPAHDEDAVATGDLVVSPSVLEEALREATTL